MERLKSPVLKDRLALWANRSADGANGQESRNRDGGSFEGAVDFRFAGQPGRPSG